TSTTLATNCGSVESLNPSTRCGLRSKRRQIRPTVEGDRPIRLAIDVLDQCVALAGASSRVATTTSSTLSNRIEGGRPGLGSSIKPSSRLSTNPPRHLATVCSITRKSAATCLLVGGGGGAAPEEHRAARPNRLPPLPPP